MRDNTLNIKCVENGLLLDNLYCISVQSGSIYNPTHGVHMSKKGINMSSNILKITHSYICFLDMNRYGRKYFIAFII